MVIHMEKIITGKVSRKIDEYCIQTLKIPSIILMERAALSVRDVVLSEISKGQKVVIVCGTGNNGADGLSAARLLNEKNVPIEVYYVGNQEKSSEEFRIQYEILKNIGINVVKIQNEITFNENCIIVDAIFGIGISRNVEGLYGGIIDAINNSGQKVISVDVPSGLCADCGKSMEHTVKAYKTITFGTVKSGLVLCDGKKYSGEIIVKEVGFDKSAYEFAKNEWADGVFRAFIREDLKLIPERSAVSNKGTYGRAKIIAGSESMSGAAYLSAIAAYRCGTGIVEVITHENNLQIIKTKLPEAIVSDYSEEIYLDSDDMAVIGPGLSINKKSGELLEKALKSKCRLVIDADGLNTISSRRELLELLHENVIITPHVKEMSRLTGKNCTEIRENIVQTAKDFSEKFGCVTVIKDAATVTANRNGEVVINFSGNSGMSTGGSGDVLTGIIIGMISQRLSVYEAACLGVYLHGLAGDIAKDKMSSYGMLASDIVDSIPEILKLADRR